MTKQQAKCPQCQQRFECEPRSDPFVHCPAESEAGDIVKIAMAFLAAVASEMEPPHVDLSCPLPGNDVDGLFDVLRDGDGPNKPYRR